MTDSEIVKALECCVTKEDCDGCPYDEVNDCFKGHEEDILDLITRQQAEIERLKTNLNVELDNFASEYDDKIKAEAYKEFAELVHCHCESIINCEWNKKVAPVSWADAYEQFDDEVDNLLKEMVGEDNASKN